MKKAEREKSRLRKTKSESSVEILKGKTDVLNIEQVMKNDEVNVQ